MLLNEKVELDLIQKLDNYENVEKSQEKIRDLYQIVGLCRKIRL